MKNAKFSLRDIRGLRLLIIVFGLVLGGFAVISRGDMSVMLLVVGLIVAIIGISMSVVSWMRRRRTDESPDA